MLLIAFLNKALDPWVRNFSNVLLLHISCDPWLQSRKSEVWTHSPLLIKLHCLFVLFKLYQLDWIIHTRLQCSWFSSISTYKISMGGWGCIRLFFFFFWWAIFVFWQFPEECLVLIEKLNKSLKMQSCLSISVIFYVFLFIWGCFDPNLSITFLQIVLMCKMFKFK